MKTAPVAVIIPFYNGSKYIERALESVRCQTLAPAEIIVVDDDSAVSEFDFLQYLALRYNFKIVHQSNGGQSAARNAGASASTSKFLSFLDQDDYYLPTHIEDLIENIPNDIHKLGWIYGDVMEADEAGNIFDTKMIGQYSQHPKTSLIQMIQRDMFVLPSACLISRKAFEAVGGFDTRLSGYEDDDLFLRIFRLNFENVFLPKPVTVWCIREGSSSYTVKMSRSRILYLRKLVDLLPDNWARKRFYARDYLLPRFHPTILLETVEALTERHSPLFSSRDEILGIFREYVAFVLSLPSIPTRIRWRLRTYRVLVSIFPVFLIRIFYRQYKRSKGFE